MRMKDLVELATSEPPPPRYTVDDIVESGLRVKRRRRAWVASGATAVVALGVAAALTAPSLAGVRSRPTVVSPGAQATGTRPAVAPEFPVSAQPFTFTFDGYRVGKLQVVKPIEVSTAYQIASIYADGLTTNDKATDSGPGGPTLYAYLTVYRPGAYDPSKLANPQHVTIAGRPGLQVTGGGNWPNTQTLAWQYGTDAWAVISINSSEPTYPSPAEVQRLAAGLRPATPAVAKVPIKMGYLPSGYHLDEVGVHAMAGLNGIAAAREGDYAGLLFSKPALPTTGLTDPFGGVDGNDPPGSFQIFVVPSHNSNQKPSSGLSCLNGFCNRWVDGGSVNVQVSSGGRLSNVEMRKILNGITVGNVHDDSTWTPIDVAVP